MSKKVALVNGIARIKKYNAVLTSHYEKLGYEVVEAKFPTGLLFCCHLHGRLHNQVEDIVHNADVIHAQSSGFFPILPYMYANKIKKPLILESPVLASHTGTLYAATNRIRHNKDVKQNKLINFILDTFAFTPKWTKETLRQLGEMKGAGDALVLHSDEDGVSDCQGLEKYLSKTYLNGKHARLFYPDTGNDFAIVSKFIQDFNKV